MSAAGGARFLAAVHPLGLLPEVREFDESTHTAAEAAAAIGCDVRAIVKSLVFDADGRIARHRDYWDAAEELYMKLPLLGRLMRWLQHHLEADSGAS